MTVTATSIKLKFPEFRDIEDAVIEFAIEEASYAGGDSWTTGYDLAVMYLSAHLISAGLDAADAMTGESSGEIAAESIGRMSIKYKTAGGDGSGSGSGSGTTATPDEFASSSYGRRYLELRDMNFIGPVIV